MLKNMDAFPITRREATRLIGGAAAVSLWPMSSTAAEKTARSMLLRPIPSTGEKIPAIGLGTSGTFDVGDSPNDRNPLKEVLSRFAELGGKVIDTSPIYGRAETVIGDLVSELHLRDKFFFATKVWTTGRQAGIDSMEQSLARLQTKHLDLMQVHNLVDLDTQLATARAWKEEGRVRYVGVTHYVESALPALEKVLQREKLDFVQINYSIAERDADERLLPLARERGVAVLVNRPFARGDLFLAYAPSRCPTGRRNSIANRGRNFFLSGFWPTKPSPAPSRRRATPGIWRTTSAAERDVFRTRRCGSEWCSWLRSSESA